MWWFDGREGDTENLHTRASHPKRCNTVNLANRAYTRKFSLRALFVGFVVVRWLLYYAHVTLHSMDIPNIEKLSIRFMIIKFKCKRWCVYVFLFLFPRWWQREKKNWFIIYFVFGFSVFSRCSSSCDYICSIIPCLFSDERKHNKTEQKQQTECVIFIRWSLHSMHKTSFRFFSSTIKSDFWKKKRI